MSLVEKIGRPGIPPLLSISPRDRAILTWVANRARAWHHRAQTAAQASAQGGTLQS